MSGIPPVTRISPDAVKGAPAWADVLVRAINGLVDYLTQSFGRTVTYPELEVRTDSTYSSGAEMDVRFKANLGGQRAAGCLVLKVTDLGFPDACLSGNFTCSTWEQQGDEMRVRFITGLEASHRYRVRFWTPV